MNKKTVIWVVVLVVLLVLVTSPFRMYNSMVSLREDVNAAWAQVENQLQRRNDLIPNYVNTVKGYAKHEKEIFIKIAEARSKLAGAKTVNEKVKANNELSSALSRLLVIVERYPQLTANQNFIRLQDELAGTENRIAVERKRYNDIVNKYNKTILRFPGNIFAKMFGFEKAEFFKVPEKAKEVPEVKF